MIPVFQQWGNLGRDAEQSVSQPALILPLGAKAGPSSGALTDIGLGVGESFFADNSNPVIQQWNGTLATRG